MFGHRSLLQVFQLTARAHYVRALGTTLALVIAFTLVSCSDFRPADPLETHLVTITDVGRDTVAAIPNEKLSTSARISIEETLSDTAIVRISGEPSFTNPMTLLLPIKNMPLTSISGLTGDSLYVKYEPYKKPISGTVSVKITFLN